MHSNGKIVLVLGKKLAILSFQFALVLHHQIRDDDLIVQELKCLTQNKIKK